MTDLDELLATVVNSATRHDVKTAAGIGAGLGAALGLRNGQPLKNAVIGAGLGAGLAWVTGELSKGEHGNLSESREDSPKFNGDLGEELTKNV